MKKKRNELVGVKEIAKLANVSLATVDRVLHNRTGVSEITRKKINAIIKTLNYQPNILARRLASGKVFQFAALIPEVSKETAYWQAPLTGILRAEAELNQYGINVVNYFFDQNDKKSFIKQTKLILDNKVDGLVMAPFFIKESILFTDACKKQKIPYVFINSDIPTQESLCYVGPELFKSGYLAASLTNYAYLKTGKMLLVNIAKKINKQHFLLRKEEGFRQYFKDKEIAAEIIKVDIHQTDYEAVQNQLQEVFEIHPDIASIFVTNSRVFLVANFLKSTRKKNVLLIGYDYIKENLQCLQDEMLNFLICQKSEEQGYRGVMALYHNLILKIKTDPMYYMPIDIVTKENYEFYRN